MRLELRDLRLVSAIAELGNLTRAGQHLHLSQSALSHQLADLEQRVGASLFERSGRRMIATRLGEHLCARAKPTLAEVREVERDLTDMVNGRDAVLRIATECYTCYHWLPPVLAAFGERHPSVDVRIVPEATAHPIRALAAGTIDLSIVNSPVKDRRIATKILFDDELVLVVSANHPLAGRDVIRPADIADERFLSYSHPDENNAFRHILAPAGVSASQLSVLPLTEAILELVRANMGVTILARWALEPFLTNGSLRAIRIAHPAAKRTWQAATRARRDIPEFVTDFVDFLRQSVRTPPKRKPQFEVIRSVARLAPRRRVTGSDRAGSSGN